jgi:NADH-ubiquinone oxidoreductase chain 2
MLLGLSIHTVESTQAFMFYLIQYSVSNLNAFILVITIGYSLYCYSYDYESTTSIIEDKSMEEKNVEKENAEKKNVDKDNAEENNSTKKIDENNKNLSDVNNSPIQLIDQLKGYYYINPILSLSLGITLFSFAGIPPLVGFFGKQMILSAAIDNGYIFMALVAILTSVISAVYYLSIIKQIFFDKPDYTLIDDLESFNTDGLISEKNTIVEKINVKINNIVISSSLSLSISIMTLAISLFIFIPAELLNIVNILAYIIFNI